METASWVICRIDTGQAVFETFNPQLLKYLNTKKYNAVPILDYLQALNRRIAEQAKGQ